MDEQHPRTAAAQVLQASRNEALSLGPVQGHDVGQETRYGGLRRSEPVLGGEGTVAALSMATLSTQI